MLKNYIPLLVFLFKFNTHGNGTGTRIQDPGKSKSEHISLVKREFLLVGFEGYSY